MDSAQANEKPQSMNNQVPPQIPPSLPFLLNNVNGFGGGGRAGVIIDQSKLYNNVPASQNNWMGQVNPNVLLSPDHFVKTSQYGNSLQSLNTVPLNQCLMNLDISTSDFSKAINFEQFNSMQVRENHDMYSNDDRRALDTSSDLIEQQKSMEQARVLEQFKALRQRQEEQKEMLKKQQQEQMEMLQKEKEKIEKYIAKQRQQTWGANGQHLNNNFAERPPTGRSPPQAKKPQSSLPHTIAQVAKISHIPEAAAFTANQNNKTPPKTRPGRPIPNIPSVASTPPEYREYGNPNLDSDTASVATTRDSIDDFFPLVDEDCDINMKKTGGLNRFQIVHNGNNYRGGGDDSDCEVGSELGNQSPRKTLDFNNHSLMSQNSDGAHPSANNNETATKKGHEAADKSPLKRKLMGQLDSLLKLEELTASIDTSNYTVAALLQNQTGMNTQVFQKQNLYQEQSQMQTNPGLKHFHFPPPPPPESSDEFLIEDDEVPFQNYRNEQFPKDVTTQHLQSTSSQNIHKDIFSSSGYSSNPRVDNVGHATRDSRIGEDEYDSSEDNLDDEEEYEDDEEPEENNEKENRIDFDDLPVGGLGAKKKTFEQLLEEELKKEEQKLAGGDGPTQNTVSPNRAPSKGVFLKRGEGIARFGLKGKPPPKKPPPPKKSAVATKNTSNKQEMAKKAPSKVHASVVEKSRMKFSPKKMATNKPVNHTKRNIKGPVDQTVKNTLNKYKEHKKEPLLGNKSESKKLVLKTNSGGVKANVINESHENNNYKDSGVEGSESNTKDVVGDISFQRVLKKKAEEEVVEAQELDEFELLEHYADDNASFLSNVSVVNKVVQEHRSQRGHLNHLKQQPAVPRENTSQPLTVATATVSTAKEPPPEYETSEADTSNSDLDQTLENEVNSPNNPAMAPSIRTCHRKVASLDKRTPENKVLYNNWNSEDSDMETPKASESSKFSNGTSNTNSTVNRNQNAHPRSSLSPPRSTDTEIKSLDVNGKVVLSSSEDEDEDENSDEDFCDEEAWDESHSEDVLSKPVANVLGNKVEVKSAIIKEKIVNPMSEESREGPSASPPPTSALVSKLFPKLKEVKKPPQLQPAQEKQLSNTSDQDVGSGVQSKLIRDKLMELEREIERFRNENTALQNLRKEREQGIEHLKKEMNEFEKQKNDELQRLQEFKAEEMRKLKKERRVFEQYQKANRTGPDKKEREEIDGLKQQISDLQEEMKRKESRWTASSGRLRDRIELLETENTELKEEIKILERRRLEAWQQKESGAKKEPIKLSSQTSFPLSSKSNGTVTTSALSSAAVSTVASSSVSGAYTRAPMSHFTSAPVGGPRPSLLPHSTMRPLRPPQAQDQALIDSGGLRHTMKDRVQGENEDGGSAWSAIGESELTSIEPEDSASNVASYPSVPQPYGAPRPSPMTHHPLSRSGGGAGKPMVRKTVALSMSNDMDKGDGKYEEVQHPDGKVERIYTNGAREVLYPNGSRKQVSRDGQSIVVSFFNGDVKHILPDQRIVYYYAEKEVKQTTYPDKLEIALFPNGQVEKTYPDGTKEVLFPDQTIKYIFPTGEEESIFTDGTVIRVDRNGVKTMEFSNGQREVHTAQFKKREYPDGTVKTVYPDGKQETCYSTGRVRVKDKDGNVIVDRRL